MNGLKVLSCARAFALHYVLYLRVLVPMAALPYRALLIRLVRMRSPILAVMQC